ncbi:hypothetical protein [Rothia nasimurium]|uniref:hypothetical protein n=1 Tax=Rothia nasimurium TaxID=85336 RepID=UPI001F400415|nr:hypothetical protein [Rothia nasimurium]
MSATTIRVTQEVRDRLKTHAKAYGHTLNEHLMALLDEEERAMRFEQLARDLKKNPPDASYHREADEWQSDAWS